jgi:hypothetical protein
MQKPAALLISLMPTLVHAEVMDKELPLSVILVIGLMGSATIFFTARHRPFLLVVLLPILGLFYFAHLSELFDPFIGSAMVAEAGDFYHLVSFISPVLVALSCAIGLALRFRNADSHT